ncbi:IclR family transcriptional regulator [Deinococcus frigens]|uniref:IclR family transcriptional regulator n=1 Tax=Deinococcus frigens TaxID=249403 RepID=UPI000555A9CC|nr:IclR family transcriptional regulator [Deinococcus frigens]
MKKSSDAIQTTEPEYGITALESALQVLETIGEHPGLKARQLAERTGLTKSKVFRIIRTLEGLGYVDLDGDHGSVLGRSAYLLGKRAEQQWSLSRAATPILDELAALTLENVHLVVREGLHSLVVDVRISPQPIRMYAQVGRIGPLHAGGTPKVLLAYAPDAVVDEVLHSSLDQFTGTTVSDAHELQQILRRIRADGYHLALSDLENDTFSIAAPVFDHRAQVVAALSIAGPVMRLDQAKRHEFIHLVVEHANELSRALGHRAEPSAAL